MNGGWIKLHRRFLEWEWYDDNNVKVVFLHCLFKANYKDKKYRGEIIKRGQFVTGREQFADEVSLSVQNVRTAFNKLESTGELTIKTTTKGTWVTICKYDSYQSKDDDDNQDSNHQVTNDQPSSNQQLTTTKNEKNVKNEKNTTDNQKIVDVISDIDFITDKNVLLALHIWNDVNDLRPDNKTTQRAKVESWSEPIRLMVERDDRTYEDIWKLWKRVQKDDFWRDNILSTSKLREKYDQLNIKLNKQKNHDKFIDQLFA